jgi:hypothetical protein
MIEKADVDQKTHQRNERTMGPSASTGPNCLAVTPPAYGIDFIDHGSEAAGRIIQAKLAVGEPDDEYEREADETADLIMRTPAQDKECEACQDQRLTIQRKAAVTRESKHAPPIAHEVLRSPGRPLDSAVRAYMEPRFGQGFSHVRVHDDKKAAESAKSIHALAYTSGSHIAFAEEQYRPTTERGKRLLAHELVHTIQQGSHTLRRKIDFTEPKPVLSDPIPLVIGGSTVLGNTLPGFNGSLLPRQGNQKAYKEAVFQVLYPRTVQSPAAQNGKTCFVDPDQFQINVSAEVQAITQPQDGKWSGTYPASALRNLPAACAGKKNDVRIEMRGKPNSAALHSKILAHENEHVADLKKLSDTELKPYHDFLIGLRGTGKTEEECVANLLSPQVGKRAAEAADRFANKWLAAVQVYDRQGGKHHSRFKSGVDPECTRINIEEI